jgi:hypothetical protein
MIARSLPPTQFPGPAQSDARGRVSMPLRRTSQGPLRGGHLRPPPGAPKLHLQKAPHRDKRTWFATAWGPVRLMMGR